MPAICVRWGGHATIDISFAAEAIWAADGDAAFDISRSYTLPILASAAGNAIAAMALTSEAAGDEKTKPRAAAV
jgi:hypothetical protein